MSHKKAAIVFAALAGLGVTALWGFSPASVEAQGIQRPSTGILIGQAGECRVWRIQDGLTEVYVSNCHISVKKE